MSKRGVLTPSLDKGQRDTNKTSEVVALDACICEASKKKVDARDITLH